MGYRVENHRVDDELDITLRLHWDEDEEEQEVAEQPPRRFPRGHRVLLMDDGRIQLVKEKPTRRGSKNRWRSSRGKRYERC